MGNSLLYHVACSTDDSESNPEDHLGMRGMTHGPEISDVHFLRAKLEEGLSPQILES